MKHFLSSCLLLTAAACSTLPPSAEEVAAANVGPAPAQARAAEIAVAELKSRLFDPAGTTMDVRPLEKGWYRVADGAQPRFAWVLTILANEPRAQGQPWILVPFRVFFLEERVVATSYTNKYSGATFITERDGGGLTRAQAGLAPAHKPQGEIPATSPQPIGEPR